MPMEPGFCVVLLIIIVGCLAGGIYNIYKGFKKMHKYKLMMDTPTSTIRSAAMGLVEVKGRAQTASPRKTPYSGSNCVYCEYRTEEYQVEHDDDGVSFEWNTISSGERKMSFMLNDETGFAYIDIEGADYKVPDTRIYYQHKRNKAPDIVVSPNSDDWQYDLRGDIYSRYKMFEIYPAGPFKSYRTRVGDKRYIEQTISPGDAVFVLGTNKPTRSAEEFIMIGKGESEPSFIISKQSEMSLVRSMRTEARMNILVGSVLICFIAVFLLLFLVLA